MKSATRQYTAFVLAVALLVGLAAIPVAASDLFRQPYSPAWPAINRAIARLRIDYNPPGGVRLPGTLPGATLPTPTSTTVTWP